MSTANSVNHIQEQVLQLTYSEDSIYDFFNIANKVYLLIYTNGGDGKKEYLDKIKKVIETQIRPLLEEELTLDEKKNLFTTAKTNITAHLKAYSKQNKK